MLHGENQSELENDAMNLYFVLLADHSLNASTFTARVAASTNADLHAAVTAAISALKGNLHGGAAEAAERGETVFEFLDRASLSSELDEFDPTARVVLMTLHSAKGLEFPVVFIIGCEDGVFPSSRAIEAGDLEEERRLAYVGVTRAKRELFVTYARTRNRHGMREWNAPSRFLGELPPQLTDAEEQQLGAAVSERIRTRYGVVQDAAVHRYVALVGTALAQVSAGPNLAWNFIVLDTDGVNALAAPGGYVHITRGALSLMKSEAELADVPDHADDLQRTSVVPQIDALAERVCVRKVLAGKNLVNHDDRLSSYLILRSEKAASLERDAHGRQIAGFDPVDQRHVHLARARRFGLVIEPEVKIVFAL